MSQLSFSSLQLQSDLLNNLETLGYTSMTEIQSQSLPHILDGNDVIAQGQTGSGKTAAFGLGLLEKLDVERFRIQSLILCPTRELADQVAKEIRKLGRGIHNIKVLTLCGGMPLGPQIGSLEHGAHIIVGTPGRIEDHLRKGKLKLDHVNLLVLDEADRMLEMGFQDALDAIIECTPSERQTLLFSATFPDQIQSIAKRIMKQPVMVQVASTHDSTSIQQHVYEIGDIDRLTAVRLLLMQHNPESAVIFCTTKRETQEIADELRRYGFSALALNGDLEQKDRDQTLTRFMNKSISVLVATDVAARGLDVEALDMVINYQFAHDNEVHVHRIGRTGRAGNQGMACTLYDEKEHYKLDALEAYLGHSIEVESLPSFDVLDKPISVPLMTTLRIDAGKKQKIRPGDILGALTRENGIAGSQVGKIQLAPNWAYVAVSRDIVKKALNMLEQGKLKGRKIRVQRL